MPNSRNALKQAPNTRAIVVGDARVTVILDSCLESPPGFRSAGDTKEGMPKAITSSIDRRPQLTVNCFLVEAGSRKILINVGAGSSQGRLVFELDALGITPEDVTHILLTHLHEHTIGGFYGSNAGSVFCHAKVYAHEAELDYWFSPNRYFPNSILKRQHEHVLGALGKSERVLWLRAGEIFPGIDLVHLPGPTPGHSGFRISSKGHSLMIWGGIISLPDLQISHPSLGMAGDVDSCRAAQSRMKIMREVSKSGEMIAGMYSSFPAFAYLTGCETKGFNLEPVMWSRSVSTARRKSVTNS